MFPRCKEDGLLPPRLTSFLPEPNQDHTTCTWQCPSPPHEHMRENGLPQSPRTAAQSSPRPGGLLGALVVFNGEMQRPRGRRQEGSVVRRTLAFTLAMLGWLPGSCMALRGRKPAAQLPSDTSSEPSTGSA